MERLQLRSDGIAETPSGNFAVFPLHRSGSNGEVVWFDFRSSMVADVTRIEWQDGFPYALLPSDVATTVLDFGYGRNLTEKEIAEYNAAVDEFLAEVAQVGENDELVPVDGDKQPETPPETPPEQPAPSADTPAPVPATPTPTDAASAAAAALVKAEQGKKK